MASTGGVDVVARIGGAVDEVGAQARGRDAGEQIPQGGSEAVGAGPRHTLLRPHHARGSRLPGKRSAARRQSDAPGLCGSLPPPRGRALHLSPRLVPAAAQALKARELRSPRWRPPFPPASLPWSCVSPR